MLSFHCLFICPEPKKYDEATFTYKTRDGNGELSEKNEKKTLSYMWHCDITSTRKSPRGDEEEEEEEQRRNKREMKDGGKRRVKQRKTMSHRTRGVHVIVFNI